MVYSSGVLDSIVLEARAKLLELVSDIHASLDFRFLFLGVSVH